MTPQPSPTDIVRSYFDWNFRVVMWPDKGELKGPTEEGWKTKPYSIEDYTTATRVGIITGQEISPGRFLHDVDIDWAPGYKIALQFLPKTEFVYGRKSKPVSHCFYTLPESIYIAPYKDPLDRTTLLEVRAAKENGELGHQSMAPPSIWQKGSDREALEFRAFGQPTFFEEVQHFKQRCTLSAIGMLLAKRLGYNGFGHEARLCWAGYLLRAGIPEEDLVKMGEAISLYCNNTEIVDVRRVVQSTNASLQNDAKKTKGGPSLAKLLGAGGKKIIDEINKWLGRDSDYIRTNDGVIIKDHQENVRRAVGILGYELSYNEFAEKMLVSDLSTTSEPGKPRLLDDRTINTIWLKIDREQRFRPTFTFYEKVLTDLCYDNAFHPVRDYLGSLSWDRQPRIDYWLSTYGQAEETGDIERGRTYLQAISAIVLIAAVRRAIRPPCKYDEMLVLQGEQGLNKSSALRALCPKDEWFSDDLPLNVDAKEVIERTLGKWIIEASDLVGGRKADIDHLKSMLSRQTDGPARMAYARVPVERHRQFVIIGTTNSDIFIADPTGARRFWPVKVKKFDAEGIARDRDQLWAEAVFREGRGESIRLPEELWSEASEHQEQRREIDAWEDILTKAARVIIPSVTGKIQVATTVLWEALDIEVGRRDRHGARRISEIMQRLGFTRGNVRTDDGVEVGYHRTTPMEGSEHYERAREDAGF